jgi:hypothetical protein
MRKPRKEAEEGKCHHKARHKRGDPDRPPSRLPGLFPTLLLIDHERLTS